MQVPASRGGESAQAEPSFLAEQPVEGGPDQGGRLVEVARVDGLRPPPWTCGPHNRSSIDLPDGRRSRALPNMHNSLAATAALIIVVSTAQLGTLALAAAAVLLLGMAVNEIYRRDR
jgi:hypothetical protein